MCVIFARTPKLDVPVWPGRRVLAFVDAVAWPTAWAACVVGIGAPAGLMGLFAVAWCSVAAVQRVLLAVGQNHRDHFTMCAFSAPCNICVPGEESAQIRRYTADGSVAASRPWPRGPVLACLGGFPDESLTPA